MGTFSNGTEGDTYRAEYCDKCIHDIRENCPIWGLHLTAMAPRAVLDLFISRKGIWNDECKLFHAFTPEEGGKGREPVADADALARWKAAQG